MNYGIWTLVPILIIIVFAVWRRNSFVALLLGSAAACLIMYGVHFPGKWVELLMRAVSDDDNQWTIMLCGLFGSLIALLRASRGTNGFRRLALKAARSGRSALLITYLLGIIIFVDDYLNMLTVGTCMRKITDERKVPREALSFVLDSTGTPVCVLLPFSTWGAFYIMLYMREDAVKNYGFSSGISMYLCLIPFMFYAIAILILVLLFILGIVPKIGPMKRAYERVEKTGEVYSRTSAELNRLEEDGRMDGNILDFLIPMGTLIFITIWKGDILTALVVSLVVCLILYVPRRILSFGKWAELLITGFADMLPTLAILVGAFTVAEASKDMGLADYVIHLLQPHLGPLNFPVLIFLAVAFLTFATSSTWGISAIIVPVIVPLSASVGANLPLTLAAIISGSTFGSHACFYSDATVLASAGARIESMDHALSQFPYALIAAGISCAAYIGAAFFV